MNEQDLTDRFDSALAGEPPLGFDPDAVVDRARAGERRRRALTASGGGVALVAVVAALVAGTTASGGTDPAPVAAAPTVQTTPAVDALVGPPTPGGVVSGPVSWPPAGTPGTVLDRAGAAELQTAARAYLGTRLPAVVDGVVGTELPPGNGHAGAFSEAAGVGQAPPPVQRGFSVGAQVRTATTTSELGLAVKAFQAPVPRIALDQECAKHTADPSRGGSAACTLRTTSDGGHLLVAEVVMAHKPGLAAPDRNQAYTLVHYYRPDGVQVTAEASTLPDAPASSVLLTVDDLVELALDPHWSV